MVLPHAEPPHLSKNLRLLRMLRATHRAGRLHRLIRGPADSCLAASLRVMSETDSVQLLCVATTRVM